MRHARTFPAVLAAATLLLGTHGARAHFILDAPVSWRTQNFLGDPQKLGPCGDDGTAARTGTVTAFQEGQTISITIRETVFHPGHYRIALATHDRSELPPEPVVTPGTMACGTVPIMDHPVFPVLADGVLAHTAPFSGAQTIRVTLPMGVTCDHCTLQVLEFMSAHPLNNPGGCFYHHCADISIAAGGSDAAVAMDVPVASDVPVRTDVAVAGDIVVANDTSTAQDAAIADVSTVRDTGTGGTPAATAGCGCRTGAPSRGSFAVLALAVLLRRKRQASRCAG